LRLIDRDQVEWTNLQRQWLFDEEDAREGQLKAVAAARALRRANSSIDCQPVVADLDSRNIEEHLEGVDLVVDATDNFETRYLLNDYCVGLGLPWIYGAAVGSYGLAFAIMPGAGPCLRCVYPEAPKGAQPTCETAGVLNTVTAQVGFWQAALAMKLLAGEAIPPLLTTFDTWEGKTRQVAIEKDAQCPCCGARDFEFLDGRRRAPVSLCGRDAVQIHERRGKLDLAALESELEGLGEAKRNDFALRFIPSEKTGGLDLELTIFPDGRAIIKGTTDPALARGVYSRYLGR
jgi:molybdopterin-synthase adenylyltransferase